VSREMMSGESFEEGRRGGGGGGIREKLGGYDNPVLPETLLSEGRGCRLEEEAPDREASSSTLDPVSSTNGQSSSSSLPKGSYPDMEKKR
jgi:hypothetical protein